MVRKYKKQRKQAKRTAFRRNFGRLFFVGKVLSVDLKKTLEKWLFYVPKSTVLSHFSMPEFVKKHPAK